MKPVDDVAGISYDSDGENEDGQGLQFWHINMNQKLVTK